MFLPSWPWHVYTLELRKIITYRADFWINFFGQMIFTLIVSYFLWSSIFADQGVDQMQGFTLPKLVLYYLIVPLIFQIQQGETIGAISTEIYEGTLNKFIIYPINFYSYKIVTFYAHASFYLLQLTILLLGYALFFYDEAIWALSLVNLILFFLVLLVSAFCYFALNSIIELIAFWADNIWSLGVILRLVTRFAGGVLIPVAFFPDWIQTFLKYTPFPYIVTFPVDVLMGNFSMHEFFANFSILILWILVFLGLARLLWKRGKYSYTGVGM
jgi:ABC-2 type transport system permease protein